jgi:undecaprenyl pyrophosphate phosphatase UppP
MDPERLDVPPRKTLWTQLCAGWRKANSARPASFYLLIAIVLVLLLALPLARSGKESAQTDKDPRRIALFLTLMFIFIAVVAVRALIDFVEILRRHRKERAQIFRSTLGDQEFVKELGRRVAEKRDK